MSPRHWTPTQVSLVESHAKEKEKHEGDEEKHEEHEGDRPCGPSQGTLAILLPPQQKSHVYGST